MRIVILATALAAAALAQIEPRIVSETLPAGSLMQIKLEITTPTPISSTGTSMQMDSAFGDFEGIALFSPAGDAFGAVVRQGTRATGRFVSPQNSLGTAPDYPILVFATPIRAGLAAGTQIPINIEAGSFWNDSSGRAYSAPNVRGGILTIGGSASITNVIPGGGALPINSNVRVLGTGFDADTRLSVDGISMSPIRLVSSNEINFTLLQPADLTARRFRLRNKDNIEVTYYSYLRPTASGSSTRPLMAQTYPVFSRQTSSSASLGIPITPTNGFVGIALLNATTNAADVQLEMLSPSGASLGKSSAALPGGSRFSRTLQELFNAAPPVGGSVRVASNVPLGIMGIIGDESAGTATAFATGAAPPPPVGQLTVSPTNLSFDYQSGGAVPPSRTIAVGSTGSALPFTAASNATWLTVAPSTGQTPANLNVNINPAGLALGQQNGVITVTPTSGGTAQTINVTLNVTAAPPPPTNATLGVSPASLSFTVSGSQQVSISTSTGTSVGFAATTSESWLTVAPPAGTAPGTVTVTVAAASLAPGSYNGTVTITPGNGAPARTIPVTLSIAGTPSVNPSISASPSSLSFTGAGSLPVNLSTSSGASVQFTASASETWLSVAPTSGTAPGSVTVTTNPGSLAAGTYNGTVIITPANGTPARTVAVTMAIGGSPPPSNVTISASPAALSFNAGGSQAVTLATSNGSSVSYTASGSEPWLSVSPASGSAPGTLSVITTPGSLGPGTYNGSVTVIPGNGTAARTIAVVLTVSQAAAITLSPSAMTFTGAQSQTLQVSAGGAAVSFAAAVTMLTGSGWLSVTPSAGTTPTTLSVNTAPGTLSPGTYEGRINIIPSSGVSPPPVAVTMVVQGAPPAGARLTVNPQTLAFDYQTGAAVPAAQLANIQSTGAAIDFTVSSNASWLTGVASQGTTPAALRVAVNPQGLAPGSYTGSLAIAPATGAAVNVAVTLRVSQPTSPAGPAISSVVNAASQLVAGVAPGTLVTIYGSSLGSATPDGQPTRVFFGTALAPVTYVSPTQVNAIVPYEVDGFTSVTAQVEYLGVRSPALAVPIAESSPALFTQNGSGRGPAAALNGDFSLNTAENPAARGSVLVLYATGAGQTNPPSNTGDIGGADLRSPALPVSVSLGGRTIVPLYAGTSPGLTTSAIQINLTIPEDLTPGSAIPISITVGNATSPLGTTVAIQ